MRREEYQLREIKKLNLLPEEIKYRYEKRYVMYSAFSFAGILVLVLIVQMIYACGLSWQINSIKNKNERYNREKEIMSDTQNSIMEYSAFLDCYNDNFFPFSLFMNDTEKCRPESVNIISIDTPDRLINEGVVEESENENDNTQEKEESVKPADENLSEEEEIQEGKIEYLTDLTGQVLTVRGFGDTQEDISKFIYDLSKLSYITSADITAIEEHRIEDGTYNIFEITVVGGDAK